MKIARYFGMFCAVALLLSLTFCSMGFYQGMQTARHIFTGADTYTCRQFTYDLENDETEKFAPMVLATVAYGSNPDRQTEERLQQQVMDEGMAPAVKKVYQLCKNNPSGHVLTLFAQSLTGVTTSPSTTSATAPVSTSAPLSNNE